MLVYYWWFITAFKIFLCANQMIEASLSGLYVDNGHAQTMMHRKLTPSDTQKVENDILTLLGLPNRPTQSHLSLQKSAPKFLLDIYKQLDDEIHHIAGRYKRSIGNGRNVFTEVDRELIDESDNILTFLSKKNRISKVRNERGRKLSFDMTEVNGDSELMMAKLRIYQNPIQRKRYLDSKELRITAYAIIKSAGALDLMMLSSINTTSNHRGWLELIVSHGLAMWLNDDRQNKGLFISVHTSDEDDHEITPDEIGLANTKGDDEHQPFMVGFFKGQNFVRMGGNGRSKRNTPENSRHFNPLLGIKPQPEMVKNCQIQTLYISFKDLKWQDWIIAPVGYGAFFCSGECNFPLNTHMNATNHAIIQTLVHLQNPSKVPRPCCAPIKLSPISVIFFLDETHVNLKKYKNMVVTSCGCH